MANTDDEEQLAIRIVAKLNDLEKGMKRAEAITTGTYDQMRKGSTRATRQMEADALRSTNRINLAMAATSSKIGGLGKAFLLSASGAALASAAAFLSSSAIIGKTKTALTEFGDIADKSLSAGLDPEAFQALAYQASLFGVELGTLSGALDTFAKNAGLAVVGKGKMVKALQALNPALLENIRNAKDQEARVRLAADAIDQAKTAAEKAALATTMFGDAGTKLVGVFDGGSAAMDRQAAKAAELGLIIDRDLIARSDELGDQMDTASKIIDVQLKQAFVNLAPVMLTAAKIAGDVAKAIADIVDSWQNLENMTSRGLNMKAASLPQESANLALELSKKRAELARLSEQQLSPASALELDSTQRSNLALQITDLDSSIKAMSERRIQIAKEMAQIEAIVAARDKALPPPNTNTGDDGTLPTLPPPGASTRNKAAEDAIRQAEAVTELISKLELERAQVGMTEVEIAKSNALRQAGAAATDEQKAKIIALIEATAAEKAAVDQVKASMDFAKDAANGFLSDLRSGLEDGKLDWEDFGNAALNVLNKIIDKIQGQLVDALFDMGNTGGGLGGILGALFGAVGSSGTGGVPAFASGTNYAPGGLALVGEKGPELVNLPRGSQVIPNGRMAASLAQGGGGSMSLSSTMHITVSGTGDKELIANLSAAGRAAMKSELDRFSKSALPRRVSEIARDPRKRG